MIHHVHPPAARQARLHNQVGWTPDAGRPEAAKRPRPPPRRADLFSSRASIPPSKKSKQRIGSNLTCGDATSNSVKSVPTTSAACCGGWSALGAAGSPSSAPAPPTAVVSDGPPLAPCRQPPTEPSSTADPCAGALAQGGELRRSCCCSCRRSCCCAKSPAVYRYACSTP